MYHFPNLDPQTRLLMLLELDRDINNGLFYEPESLNTYGKYEYKSLLRTAFEKGSVGSLETSLIPAYFNTTFKNGRKVPMNMRSMLAFSDFNRYYVRALFIRAIQENRYLTVYRARESTNQRNESIVRVGTVYAKKERLIELLAILRDYRLLFKRGNGIDFMKPNSGLSVMLSNI